MNRENDEILVRRALAGDPRGFALLCERYYPALVATAHSVLMDGHMAEDIAQDAVAEACRRLRTLRKPERFGAWLGAICRNRARSAIREARRRRKAAEGHVTPERDDDPEESATLAEAVASLPEHLRQVVLLRYSNDLTYEQMSRVLGLSGQAINGRLRRARRRIARFMKTKGFEV